MQDSLSPDLFDSQDELQQESKSEKISVDVNDGRAWRGSSMAEILLDNNPWNHHCNPVSPSKNHTVLFEVPCTLNGLPKPHKSLPNLWEPDHVRMPFSPRNLYPSKEGDKESVKPRWELIETKLLSPIYSSKELEEAIHSYNLRRRKLEALYHFFEETLEEDESEHFFNTLLLQIIQLALQMPELLPSGIPLLRAGRAHAVSLSQQQCACILANAFLCTFPWRKDMIKYPGINFNRLFECSTGAAPYVEEKIKCLLHYFRRVTTNMPNGVITFERKLVARSRLPRWDRLENSLSDTRLHITSEGTIEDGGLGLLQMDFANCMLGGGVLTYGCVQEEIRFVICPELIVGCLFTEQLGPTEALQITGVERFSNYKGYAQTFQWAGDYQDHTPYDLSGRRKTTVVAIDALCYSKQSIQFSASRMLRELNKAYVGFHEDTRNVKDARLAAVATGNWGCGAFRGNPRLKALIQIMASNAAKRHIVYYTFENVELRNDIFGIHRFLAQHRVKICQLWRYLCRFNEAQLKPSNLYPFIQQAHLDSLRQVSRPITASSSSSSTKSPDNKDKSASQVSDYSKDNMEIDSDFSEDESPVVSQNVSNSFESLSVKTPDRKFVSNTNEKNPRSKTKQSEEKRKKNYERFKHFLYSSDEEETVISPEKEQIGLLAAADSYNKNVMDDGKNPKEDVCEEMEVSLEEIKCEEVPQVTTPSRNVFKSKTKMSNKKISDYFKTVPK